MTTRKKTYNVEGEGNSISFIPVLEGVRIYLTHSDSERELLIPQRDLANMTNLLYNLIDEKRYQATWLEFCEHMGVVYDRVINTTWTTWTNIIGDEDCIIITDITDDIEVIVFTVSTLKKIYANLLFSCTMLCEAV